MDFDLSDDQKMLVKTVSDFGKKESTVERFRKLRDDAEGIGWDRATWKKMGELGWLSIPFPEEAGGLGGSFVDAALILEQLGKTLVPEPYLASVVLGGHALWLGGSAEQHEQLLQPMMEGDTTLALAYAEPGIRFDPRCCATTAKREGDGWRLEGEKAFVQNGHAADHLVIAAMSDEGMQLFVVDGADVKRRTTKHIDGHRGAHVDLAGVVVPESRRLVARPATEVLERVLDFGAAATVAEGLGVAFSMLWMTVEYLKTREQFDVKIGTFQALQHRAVEMFVEVELLKSINVESMIRASEEGPERPAAISAAKLQLAQGGQLVSRQAIQLHGGVGVTDEHDVGLYFKRMHALVTLCGDEAAHVARYAES
ncbi:MAG: acyl-CoA dehydrogenase family protein [Myxococcales bacterium]|nr:acyl-CoA dehydrogenase family protein [Myxococcales bacterium]